MQERYEELKHLKSDIDTFMGKEVKPKESIIKQINKSVEEHLKQTVKTQKQDIER